MNKELIKKFRSNLKKNNIDYYITFSSDPHISEYIDPVFDEKYSFTGFNGSFGIVIITQEEIILWTDSRYYLEAEKLAHRNNFVFKKYEGDKSWIDWIAKNFSDESKIAFRYSCTSAQNYLKIKDINKNLEFINLDKISGFDTVDNLKFNKIFKLEDNFKIVEERINYIRENILDTKKNEFILLSSLDDIAWLTNLRGSDIEFNPVFYSYFILSQNRAVLFCKERQIEDSENLNKLGIEIQNYSIDEVKKKIQEITTDYTNVLFSKIGLNSLLYNFLEELKEKNNLQFFSLDDFYIYKSSKTAWEISQIKKAMICDGIALTLFHKEFASSKVWGKSEYELGQLIAEKRKIAANRLEVKYFSESFNAIAAWGENGAIVHYKPDKEASLKVMPGDIENQVLLLDSGGQYSCGTTDVTRVFVKGQASKEFIKDYSLVLKGHLELKNAVFPTDTANSKLDTLARMHLWKDEKDYGHGTGHGVGYCLNVHEGPFGIRKNSSTLTFFPGLLLTNEPGFYKEGFYGIRIENMLLVENAGEGFLKFKDLTLFPYDLNLIDKKILGKKKYKEVKNYHKNIYSILKDYLTKEEQVFLKKYSKI